MAYINAITCTPITEIPDIAHDVVIRIAGAASAKVESFSYQTICWSIDVCLGQLVSLTDQM